MQRTRQDAMDGLLPDEREQFILERLRTQGRVLASEIAAELNTSEHTVRRHLRDLASAGLCKRVYGGALLTSPSHLNASTRMKADVDRKQRLAIAAASIVQPRQVILLDAGSTNVAIAQALPDNAGLTVVTNSPEACLRLRARVDRAAAGPADQSRRLLPGCVRPRSRRRHCRFQCRRCRTQTRHAQIEQRARDCDDDRKADDSGAFRCRASVRHRLSDR
jgi:DeoR/GlpR family transcriptional regulator of sugar metabolism